MTFTDTAAKEVIKIMVRDGLDPEETAIRMGVKGGGCSGFFNGTKIFIFFHTIGF